MEGNYEYGPSHMAQGERSLTMKGNYEYDPSHMAQGEGSLTRIHTTRDTLGQWGGRENEPITPRDGKEHDARDWVGWGELVRGVSDCQLPSKPRVSQRSLPSTHHRASLHHHAPRYLLQRPLHPLCHPIGFRCPKWCKFLCDSALPEPHAKSCASKLPSIISPPPHKLKPPSHSLTRPSFPSSELLSPPWSACLFINVDITWNTSPCSTAPKSHFSKPIDMPFP